MPSQRIVIERSLYGAVAAVFDRDTDRVRLLIDGLESVEASEIVDKGSLLLLSPLADIAASVGVPVGLFAEDLAELFFRLDVDGLLGDAAADIGALTTLRMVERDAAPDTVLLSRHQPAEVAVVMVSFLRAVLGWTAYLQGVDGGDLARRFCLGAASEE